MLVHLQRADGNVAKICNDFFGLTHACAEARVRRRWGSQAERQITRGTARASLLPYKTVLTDHLML